MLKNVDKYKEHKKDLNHTKKMLWIVKLGYNILFYSYLVINYNIII